MTEPVSLMNLYAYLPKHQYIYIPTRELWPASSVDDKLPRVGRIKASKWLAQNRAVQQLTWSPGDEMIIRDKYVAGGGWEPHEGASVFNLYHPPDLPVNGNPMAQIQINRQPGANVVETVQRVKALMPQFQAQLPPTVRFKIASDRTIKIGRAHV